MAHLKGRVALVTGGSRGIGRVISTVLAREGASVVLTYREKSALAEGVVKEIVSKGGNAMALCMRMEERSSIRQTIDIIRSELGYVDILVNNAAIAQEKSFDTITDEDWDRMMTVNLRGPFICFQEILPDMVSRGWGRIINISSIGGQWGGVNQIHYAVSKAGLIGLTRSLARVYSRYGITINAVAPGLVGTGMAEAELKRPDGQDKVRQIPAGRIATPEEVAEVVLFLAGNSAGYITGQTINVNGGMYFG